MTREFEFSRRKVLAALGTVGAASAGTGLGTSAFFSDQETFGNDSLVAGTLDAKVAYSAHYSDWSSDEDDGVAVRMWEGPPGTTGGPADLRADETGLPTNGAWLVAVDDPDKFLTNTQYSEAGDASCPDGSNAEDIEQPVIELEDVKPGDFGEITIDFALCDNPGFIWLNGELRSASENDLTEPEAADEDEDGDADSTDPVDVELLDAVQAAVWVDDGNAYIDNEVLAIEGSLRTVLKELGTGPGLALGGNVDSGDSLSRSCFSPARKGAGTADGHSISLAWWLPVDHGDEVQTDAVTFDIGLYTEQCRHNEGTAADLEALVTAPETQQLLTDLGHPAPADPTVAGFGELGPVKLAFDQARTRSLDLDRPVETGTGDQTSAIHATRVPSPVGSLQLLSAEGELLVGPAFVFDAETPASTKDRLDVTGELGWPDGLPAALVVRGPATLFMRDLSVAERTQAAQAAGRPVEIAAALAAGGPGVYVVPPPATSGDGTAGDMTEPRTRLLTDGGSACAPLPPVLCDAATTSTTPVYGPDFELVDSISDERLFERFALEAADCLVSFVDCTRSVLTEGKRALTLTLSGCSRLSAAAILLQREAVAALVGEENVPDGDYETSPSFELVSGCAIIFGFLVGAATAFFFKTRCVAGAKRCLLRADISEPRLPIELPLNPKGTFLRADFDPPAPRVIDLRLLNLSSGDRITIEQTGDTTSRPGGPENRHSTIAVFSGSDRLLAPSKLNRVPDAIKAGTNAETPKTFFGNQPTDIPEDFRVTNFDGSVSSVTVTVPDGATHLFVGAEDSEPTDNRDPDDDYRVTIRRG
jgi:hypothetical protein